MTYYSNFAAMLSSEFHLYLMEHNRILPENALVVFQVNGEDGFNKWHKSITLKNREPKQKVIMVNLNKWRRHSSFARIQMQKAVA